jgi:peptidoglycan/LPS O-acetylase OafA/YrhL
MPKHKLLYIEGLRGLAAAQVVLLHYCSAFFPFMAHVRGPVHYAWEATLKHSPLFFLIDGHSAVCLFFILSGFVLAPSFQYSQSRFLQLALKRFLRLFIPVFVASAIALSLLLLMPYAKTSAAAMSLSEWLISFEHNPLTIGSLTRESMLNSMLIGYQGSSLFDHIPNSIQSLVPADISQSLNVPTWSLHIEFWGSMLVLILAVTHRIIVGRWFYVVFVVALLVAGTSEYSLFLFGFLLYQLHGTLLRPRHVSVAIVGTTLALTGMYICINKDVHVVNVLLDNLRGFTLLDARANFIWQSQVGAMLIFSGVILNATVRNWFAGRITQWLGKVSFSVYLLHFPILFTLSCLVFSYLAQFSYALGCIAALMVGIGVTYATATIFEKHIDRRAVLFSKRIIGE